MVEQGRLTLEFPQDLEGLCGDRLNSRMRALGKLIGREPIVRAVPARAAAEVGSLAASCALPRFRRSRGADAAGARR